MQLSGGNFQKVGLKTIKIALEIPRATHVVEKMNRKKKKKKKKKTIFLAAFSCFLGVWAF